jgi:hypothetical protein
MRPRPSKEERTEKEEKEGEGRRKHDRRQTHVHLLRRILDPFRVNFQNLSFSFESKTIFEALESSCEALETEFDALESIFEVGFVFFSVFRLGLARNEERRRRWWVTAVAGR